MDMSDDEKRQLLSVLGKHSGVNEADEAATQKRVHRTAKHDKAHVFLRGAFQQLTRALSALDDSQVNLAKHLNGVIRDTQEALFEVNGTR